MSGGNFRVLVVDDDELAVAAMSSVLAEAGCMVTNLATPIGVTQIVLNHDIDVVILDLNMPALPGDRLAAMLRGNKRLSDIPVVIVSAASESELRQIVLRVPGVVALSKRRVRTDLVRVVRELAVRRRGGEPMGTALSSTVSPSLMPPRISLMPEAPHHSLVTIKGASASPLQSLPRRIVEMTRLWREASLGSLRSYKTLQTELQAVRRECEALPFECLLDLATALDDMVRMLRPGSQAPTSVSGAVLAGFNLLARLSRAPESAKDAELLAILGRFSDERKRLLDATPLVPAKKAVDTEPGNIAKTDDVAGVA